MSSRRDEIVLKDIVHAAQQVVAFVDGFNKETFIYDWKTRSAVLYQLTVIGEAARRLSAGFRTAHEQIPWLLMAGMGDHLVHACDLVDWDEVWNTATKDIPDLLGKIGQIPGL